MHYNNGYHTCIYVYSDFDYYIKYKLLNKCYFNLLQIDLFIENNLINKHCW